MQFLFLTQALLLFSFLQGALCLPTGQPHALDIDAPVETSTPNSALEVRATLEKRDSWDCKGSAMCSSVSQGACYGALSYFKTNEVYWTEKRAFVKYDSIANGHCLAMWTCGSVQDYVSAAQAGVSQGWFLVHKANSIYNEGGCKKCGSVWFWGSCRFTFNYCSSNCSGK
ncbi:hypothetical protein TWF481_009112 [Arthrobotrys musiformis]|uniref:Uncharacterized protein n=1 Tax=Arthrobotrys musiformis TaxID=47236 RepID=A0AAV9W8I4_9PEZI